MLRGEEQGIKNLYTSSNSTPFIAPWTKFQAYNPTDVGGEVKAGVLQQLTDVRPIKLEPQDLLT